MFGAHAIGSTAEPQVSGLASLGCAPYSLPSHLQAIHLQLKKRSVEALHAPGGAGAAARGAAARGGSRPAAGPPPARRRRRTPRGAVPVVDE